MLTSETVSEPSYRSELREAGPAQAEGSDADHPRCSQRLRRRVPVRKDVAKHEEVSLQKQRGFFCCMLTSGTVSEPPSKQIGVAGRQKRWTIRTSTRGI